MTLKQVLKRAVKECAIDLEEHGGIILVDKTGHNFEFVYINNVNTGQSLAQHLWTGNGVEFAELIIPQVRKGWKIYASFHTHPQFRAFPSNIDITQLFRGFPLNYIYSNRDRELNAFKLDRATDNYEATPYTEYLK